jgi:hypothetical protein
VGEGVYFYGVSSAVAGTSEGGRTRNSLQPPKQLQAVPYSLFPAVQSTAPKASAALIPPNPKLFDTTRRTGISKPSPVT